jgi:hypothetical protein
MAWAIMDSDLVKIQELVSVGHDLLGAIELLVNVEEGAHERLSEEIMELDGQANSLA